MKFSVVLLVAFVGIAASSTIPQLKHHRVVKGKELLEKQRQIFQLYDRAFQPIRQPELLEFARIYNIEEHVEDFTRPEVVEEFLGFFKYNPIKKGEIFSPFHGEHSRQAIALFRVFFFAKNYETFYKTAIWARQYVNAGMFIHSFTIAVLHRADTQDVVLPPIYEVNPFFFFPSEVIFAAQYYKQVHEPRKMDQNEEEFHGYTIDANYSGHYLNLHPEQSLSYYLEDIGLNTMLYNYHMQAPGWMKNGEYGLEFKNRGALGYFKTQQVVARYYLERLANNLGEIPLLDWDVPVETPYTPSLVYPNGLEFPSRPKFANLHEYFYTYGQKSTNSKYSYSFNRVKDLERRILDTADSGHALTEDGKIVELDSNSQEGLNIISNLIEGNADSINNDFYGGLRVYMRHLLGYSNQPLNEHKLVPSVLEQVATTYRDPVAYQALKKYLGYYHRFFKHITPYTKKDLTVPGVEITDAEVDQLITFFDTHYSDISNAVFYGPHEKRFDFNVRVRQQRLNHKPFTYKLHVKSNENQKVVVKVFLGPKYDEYNRYINLTENHLNFVELDNYVYELKSGENVVERSSRQFNHFTPDSVSVGKQYHQVLEAIQQNGEFQIDDRQNGYRWPQRFLLPKGSQSGTKFQFFFFVYPYTSQEDIYIVDINQPYGYPLERNVKYDAVFDVPNAHFHEVKIYHKQENALNVVEHEH